MDNSTFNNIFTKVKLPPSGFILQKDVYTTNLLYANDQFPLTALTKRIPFRQQYEKSEKKKQNHNHSVRILREKGNISENLKKKKTYYLLNDYNPKQQFKNKKLKFPLPKIKALPLTCLNLHEEISKRDLKIRNMDDDLNITSKIGKKLIYKFKFNENKLSNSQKSNFPLLFKSRKKLINKNNKNVIKSNKLHKKREYDKSMDKISLKHIVGQLNNELRNIRQNELDRKRSFIRDKFFSTQIYIENVMDSNNVENKYHVSNINIDD